MQMNLNVRQQAGRQTCTHIECTEWSIAKTNSGVFWRHLCHFDANAMHFVRENYVLMIIYCFFFRWNRCGVRVGGSETISPSVSVCVCEREIVTHSHRQTDTRVTIDRFESTQWESKMECHFPQFYCSSPKHLTLCFSTEIFFDSHIHSLLCHHHRSAASSHIHVGARTHVE